MNSRITAKPHAYYVRECLYSQWYPKIKYYRRGNYFEINITWFYRTFTFMRSKV